MPGYRAALTCGDARNAVRDAKRVVAADALVRARSRYQPGRAPTADAGRDEQGGTGVSDEIWILGAAGRSGRAIAAQVAARGHVPVLVGRDAARLRAVAGTVGGARIVPAADVAATAAALAADAPTVVVNTIGPFGETAPPIVRAGAPGTHYVDLANDLRALTGVLDRHDEAAAAGRSLVTGAGFGVYGTESVVLALCRDRPAPARVRVDAVPSVASGDDVVGHALAASLVDGLAAGGRVYRGGRVVRARLGSGVERRALPDGTTVRTTAVPTGELEAARRASGAPSVVAASSEVPAGPLVRAVLPVVAALLSLPPVRRAATRRLAAVRITPNPHRRPDTWAYARIEGTDRAVREGWLRVDAMGFTAAVAAEVACRLARGEGRPGAWTPGALFGPDLATELGGEFRLG